MARFRAVVLRRSHELGGAPERGPEELKQIDDLGLLLLDMAIAEVSAIGGDVNHLRLHAESQSRRYRSARRQTSKHRRRGLYYHGGTCRTLPYPVCMGGE